MKSKGRLIGVMALSLLLAVLIAKGGGGGGGGSDLALSGVTESPSKVDAKAAREQAKEQPKSELRLLNEETLATYRQYLDRAVNQQVLSSADEAQQTGESQMQIIWMRQWKVVSSLEWEMANGAGEQSEVVRRSLVLDLHVLQLAEAVITNKTPLRFPDASQQGKSVVEKMKERLNRQGVPGEQQPAG